MPLDINHSQNWFNHGMGEELLQAQADRLPNLVPENYYQQAVWVQNSQLEVCENLNIGQMTYVSTAMSTKGGVVAKPEHLPFAEHSVDLLFLMHTLDYCDDPVAALREASQVLNAEGIMVLTGFNPHSLYGACKLFRSSKTQPYSARFIAAKVVQDWLALLGFTLLGISMLEYKPPIANQKIRSKLRFMDTTGERWWPVCGAVYVLVAKKQIYSKINTKRASGRRRDWLRILNPLPADIKKNP